MRSAARHVHWFMQLQQAHYSHHTSSDAEPLASASATSLPSVVAHLHSEVAELRRGIAELHRGHSEGEGVIAALKSEVQDLKDRLGEFVAMTAPPASALGFHEEPVAKAEAAADAGAHSAHTGLVDLKFEAEEAHPGGGPRVPQGDRLQARPARAGGGGPGVPRGDRLEARPARAGAQAEEGTATTPQLSGGEAAGRRAEQGEGSGGPSSARSGQACSDTGPRIEQSSDDALVQLASNIAAAMHSKDAFEKVKGMISDEIAKLEKSAGEERRIATRS